MALAGTDKTAKSLRRSRAILRFLPKRNRQNCQKGCQVPSSVLLSVLSVGSARGRDNFGFTRYRVRDRPGVCSTTSTSRSRSESTSTAPAAASRVARPIQTLSVDIPQRELVIHLARQN